MKQFGKMNFKIYFIFFILALALGGVGARFYYVQIVKHDYYYDLAKKTYTSTLKKPKLRGQVFDYDGNLLIGNVYSVRFNADPSKVGGEQQCRRIAQFFADRTGASFDTLFNRLMKKTYESVNPETGEVETKPYLDAPLVRDIDFEVAQALAIEIAELKFKGISHIVSSRRSYPKNELCSNLLGYSDVEKDQIAPRAGIEKTFDETMRPETEIIIYEKDLQGRKIIYGESSVSRVGRDGSDIYLTIQEPLQAIVEEELDKLYEKWNPISVSAIMVNPETGDVLAIAQRPAFNPNDRATMKNQLAVRPLIAEDTFEPGSVMKPMVYAWALDRGYITPDTVIDAPLSRVWTYMGRPLRDSHVIGKTDVRGHLRESANIATAKIAVRMGKDELLKAIRSFGMLEKTGLPFPTENSGFTVKNKDWYPITTSRVCLGQSINLTTLQLARAYSMIANGGYRVDLRLIDRVGFEDGFQKMPIVRADRSIFNRPQTHSEIISMMKEIVMSGTGTKGQIPGYYAAAKTGTGEKNEKGVYVKKFNTSFCGFVPADDPKFVLVVSVNEPKGAERELYGGTVAGPTFGAIAKAALDYMRVPMEVDVDRWEAQRKDRVKHRQSDRERFANRTAAF